MSKEFKLNLSENLEDFCCSKVIKFKILIKIAKSMTATCCYLTQFIIRMLWNYKSSKTLDLGKIQFVVSDNRLLIGNSFNH